jgi:hypothetical protein
VSYGGPDGGALSGVLFVPYELDKAGMACGGALDDLGRAVVGSVVHGDDLPLYAWR